MLANVDLKQITISSSYKKHILKLWNNVKRPQNYKTKKQEKCFHGNTCLLPDTSIQESNHTQTLMPLNIHAKFS